METQKIYLVSYTTHSYEQVVSHYNAYHSKDAANEAVINLWQSIADYYFQKENLSYQIIHHYQQEKLDEIFTGNRTHRMAIKEIEQEIAELENPLPHFDVDRNIICIEDIKLINP
jgi:type II secretory pathway component HofQ